LFLFSAIGRIKVDDDAVAFDIKGNVYRGDALPTATMLLVSIGAKAARVDGVCHEITALSCIGNIFDAESMLEGELGDEFNDIEEEDANAEWRREESDKKKDAKKAKKADSGKKSQGSSKKATKGSGKSTATKSSKSAKPSASKKPSSVAKPAKAAKKKSKVFHSSIRLVDVFQVPHRSVINTGF
jgi:Mg-chelatase subunit ChlI